MAVYLDMIPNKYFINYIIKQDYQILNRITKQNKKVLSKQELIWNQQNCKTYFQLLSFLYSI